MLSGTATRLMRTILVGREQKFIFTQRDSITYPVIDKLDLYIHIPFCKSMCPYCPYNRIAYNKDLVKPYLDALLQEVKQYHLRFGNIEITSIYIGGGTPTNMIDELQILLDEIRKKFVISGDICIETSPNDLNVSMIEKMERMGISLLSIGIQSFENDHLKTLGRNYDAAMAEEALKLAVAANFKSVNVDLMFVLPNQKRERVLADIDKAVSIGADQVTTYPLFTFPYTSIGKHLKLNRLKMPNFFARRKMYRTIHNHCEKKGFHRVSVWGFKNDRGFRYSSVTRQNYIGIGAGACSRLPEIFYFNTFFVKEYISSVMQNKLPMALAMDITPKLANFYWLYWRYYDTEISKKEIVTRFGKNDQKLGALFTIQKKLGLYIDELSHIRLTERGAFYIHLIQNYFILDYINKVWTVAQKEAWPEFIEI